MARLTLHALAARTAGRLASFGRRVAMVALAVGALCALAPQTGGAQFGMLKKLKQAKDAATAPDSAARARDSLAKIQNLSAGDVVITADSASGKGAARGKSMFQRAAKAASKASDKFEQTTGVSVTDAALAASGAGLAGIAARKMGVDPASIAANAMGQASAAAQRRATAGNAIASPAGMMRGLVGAGGSPAGMPDAQLMLDFQQQMLEVATQATAGDAGARAKLDAWTVLSLKYEREATPLSTAMAAGDLAAYAKLQALQATMMRDWLNRYGVARRAH